MPYNMREGPNQWYRPRTRLQIVKNTEGRPIRIFMSQVFPGIRGYFHDMGYPFPS